ncbi:response regulator [Myxococcota bacterium]|nr:response regulator [Myxococcota bacterium]MBU1431328.1 response regulator [Myxococcota bacterium]MBU1897671.1 response regulator [Myxococcota bacterium]
MPQKTVLIVEDSAHLRRLVSYNLQRAGLRVLSAEDGRAAVAHLQQTIPDLILLDLRMPKMDGFELLTLMRRYPKAARIPVIVFTALSEDVDVDRALALGVIDYIIKPLDPAILLSRVESALSDEPEEDWQGGNRRRFLRGRIADLEIGPQAWGVDLSESGISWRAERPPVVGEIVAFNSKRLFEALGIREQLLRARVLYVLPLGRRHGYRVGAAFVGLTEQTRAAMRRYVLNRQARSAPLRRED